MIDGCFFCSESSQYIAAHRRLYEAVCRLITVKIVADLLLYLALSCDGRMIISSCTESSQVSASRQRQQRVGAEG